MLGTAPEPAFTRRAEIHRPDTFLLSIGGTLAYPPPVFRLSILLPAMVCAFVARAEAASWAPAAPSDLIEEADAVCVGGILREEAFRDAKSGRIYTSWAVRVGEGIVGRFPEVLRVVTRGGALDGEGQRSGFAPDLAVGETRLFVLRRRENGTLYPFRGESTAPLYAADRPSPADDLAELARRMAPDLAGDDVRDQGLGIDPSDVELTVSSASSLEPTNSGLLENQGVPSRFLRADQGKPIRYLIDDELLPSGVDRQEARTAKKRGPPWTMRWRHGRKRLR